MLMTLKQPASDADQGHWQICCFTLQHKRSKGQSYKQHHPLSIPDRVWKHSGCLAFFQSSYCCTCSYSGVRVPGVHKVHSLYERNFVDDASCTSVHGKAVSCKVDAVQIKRELQSIWNLYLFSLNAWFRTITQLMPNWSKIILECSNISFDLRSLFTSFI